MSRIGFVGLGNMGAPMAANLAKAGHEVLGFDLSDITVDGVEKVASARDAAVAELVITMLPNGAIVRSVYEDIVPAAPAGACLIDCSTIDVESARAGPHHGGGGRPAFGRCAGLGRGWRGERWHADLHGRWQ